MTTLQLHYITRTVSSACGMQDLDSDPGVFWKANVLVWTHFWVFRGPKTGQTAQLVGDDGCVCMYVCTIYPYDVRIHSMCKCVNTAVQRMGMDDGCLGVDTG